MCYDGEYNRVAIPAGTYNFNVVITDNGNENLKTTVVVTFVLQNGVVVSGTVRDAGGQPAKNIIVRGYTKNDAYGRYYTMSTTTQTDGTYTTRVIPGDYYTYCGGGYDVTVGNVFNSNTTKNFVMPCYRVNFVLNVPRAAGYRNVDIDLIDSYGNIKYISAENGSRDGDFSLYAYLMPGTYEIDSYYGERSEYSNSAEVCSKINSSTNSDGTKLYKLTDSLGYYRVAGTFSVTGNSTVTLSATKVQ